MSVKRGSSKKSIKFLRNKCQIEVKKDRKFTPGEKGVDQRLDGWMTFKRTYERWGLKGGEGKLRIESSGGE
jgi:hypothetical protein